MAKRKNSSVDTGTKSIIFLGILGIFGLFIGLVFLTGALAKISTYISLVALILVMTYYTADAVALMYDFYEANRPIARFIPFICELYLLDIKYRRACFGMLGASIVFVGLAWLPYSVKAMLGETFATSSAFYFMLIAIVVLVVMEIVIGVGIMSTVNDICKDWKRIVKTDVGSIRRLAPLAFIPFVRVFAIYALRKPLDTLVTFRNETYSSDAEVDVVADDEDEEDYDDYDYDEDED